MISLSKVYVIVSWNFDVSHETHDTWDRLSSNEVISKCPSSNVLNSSSQEPELVFQRLPSKKFTKSDFKFTYLEKLFNEDDPFLV